MFLKRVPFFGRQKHFRMIYEDTNDLKAGIIHLCELLKKDIFWVEVFNRDSLNAWISEFSQGMFHYKNFNIYSCESVTKMMEPLNLDATRFLNIYSLETEYISENVRKTKGNCSFNLGLDNYLDYTEGMVDISRYDEATLAKLWSAL